MRIVLGAVAEEGTTVAWNGAAWEAGGVLGGGVDAADDTEEDEDSDADDAEPIVGIAITTPADSRTRWANSAAGSSEDSSDDDTLIPLGTEP